MSKRILFVATIGQHLLRFHMPTIFWLKSEGYEVEAACASGDELSAFIKVHNTSFERTPFSIRNIKAFFQLRNIIKRQDYKIIHCHTATGSVITRLAALPFRRKKNIKIIYTAHGFHFYKGCPWYYWMVYYPVELICSKFLDCQITINEEDFLLAKSRFFCKDVRKISGMGVDSSRFVPMTVIEKVSFKNEFSISEETKILVYVAEFIHRKNHDFIINVAISLKRSLSKFIIILPGRGKLLNSIQEKVNLLGLQDVVLFPGFRNDIEKIVGFADIAISSSRQEGLGMNLIEALMCGVPAVASNNRGHREIICHGENGFLFRNNNQLEFISIINRLISDPILYKKLSDMARNSVFKFELQFSLKQIKEIYSDYLK